MWFVNFFILFLFLYLVVRNEVFQLYVKVVELIFQGFKGWCSLNCADKSVIFSGNNCCLCVKFLIPLCPEVGCGKCCISCSKGRPSSFFWVLILIFECPVCGVIIGNFGEGIREKCMLHLGFVAVGIYCTSSMMHLGVGSMISRNNSQMRGKMRSSLNPS